jgi:hypothetical protein
MKRRAPDLDPELEAFLRPREIIRSVPPGVRARALIRAKRVIATGGAAPATPGPQRLDVEWRRVPRGRPVLRLALTISLALVAGTVGAMVAVHGRSARTVLAPAPDLGPPKPTPSAPEAPGETLEAPAVPGKPLPPTRVHRASAERDSVVVELGLLQRAQTAYAQHDCSRTLMLLAEHARRFPHSRLGEERDALRVRALGCAGHRQEAQRAAAEFAARFPRSVLLTRSGEGERTVE